MNNEPKKKEQVIQVVVPKSGPKSRPENWPQFGESLLFS